MKITEMINQIKTPESYQPIDTLDICSNLIIGGGSLMGIKNFAPLLIGNGDLPILWLYGRDKKTQWVQLISENHSNYETLQIEKKPFEKTIIVKFQDVIVIKAKMEGEDYCVVDTLDLRPVGFNIYGDRNTLNVGEGKLVSNTFHGISYMIGMDE